MTPDELYSASQLLFLATQEAARAVGTLLKAANRIETLERALREILTSAEYAGDYDYIADICRKVLENDA